MGIQISLFTERKKEKTEEFICTAIKQVPLKTAVLLR